MAIPVVAIVGRPNIGKSTIFNRVIGDRVSIVEDKPGVTRDRIYGTGEWLNRHFHLIDTGGIEVGDEPLLQMMRHQAELAIDEADVIIFMVNGREGITAADEEVANMLFRSNKPVVVAVNKVDNFEMRDLMYEFYSLGFGDLFPISGTHGLGLGDLLDRVLELAPDKEELEYDESTIKFALIGRPNVGKSSMTNSILGEERVIVSNIAGTTRDAIDTPFTRDDQEYVIIDTAGMRKRGKVYVVLDGEEGIIEQDKKVAGYAHEAGRAVIIVVNKWDAVEKDDKTMKKMQEEIREEFRFLDYAPIVFVSAKTKRRLQTLLPVIQQAAHSHAQRIQTSVLNDVIVDAVAMNPAPTDKGVRLRINYATQVASRPPTFVLFVNDPELLHFSYKRYLENRIREAFDFTGTPIRILARQKQ